MKLIRYLFITFSLFFCFTQASLADSANPLVQQKMLQSQQVIQRQGGIWAEHQADVFKQMKANLHIQSKPQQGVIALISFSMPKASIRQLLVEAKAYHVPVIIRGLVNNSFKQTHQMLNQILKKGKRSLNGSVQLNPMWFRQFNITQVPAFVAYQRDQSCALGHLCHKTQFDVVTGNIELTQALTFLRDKASSVSASIASEYLTQPMDLKTWLNI